MYNLTNGEHMATKKLKRTLTENGAPKRRKTYARWANRRERQRTRLALRMQDPEEIQIAREPRQWRRTYGWSGVIKRWMHAHVNQPWDQVHAKACQLFNQDTLLGARLLDEHLRDQVDRDAKTYPPTPLWGRGYDYGRDDLFVDESGILRRGDEKSYPRWQSPAPGVNVESWMGHRQIGQIGKVLYWFIPVSAPTPILEDVPCHGGTYQRPAFYVHMHTGWRQDLPLTQQEIEHFNTLPAWQQRELLEDNPIAHAA